MHHQLIIPLENLHSRKEEIDLKGSHSYICPCFVILPPTIRRSSPSVTSTRAIKLRTSLQYQSSRILSAAITILPPSLKVQMHAQKLAYRTLVSPVHQPSTRIKHLRSFSNMKSPTMKEKSHTQSMATHLPSTQENLPVALPKTSGS